MYSASGRTGIKVFSVSSVGKVEPLGSVQTRGCAKNIVVQGSYGYVADGKKGLSIIDLSIPTDPVLQNEGFNSGNITCYDVDLGVVDGSSYAFLACGQNGVKVINITGSYFQKSERDTPGNAIGVSYDGTRLAVADSTGLYVYQVSDQGTLSLEKSMTTGNIQAVDIFLSGDTLFAANGQYGFIVWNLLTNNSENVSTSGYCTGIYAKGKALYISEKDKGLKIYDFSTAGQYTEVGYYDTGGRARGLAVSGDYISVANGEDGVFLFESKIKPSVYIWPTTLNFGPVQQDKTRPKILWVKNTGTTLLKITGISLGYDEYSFSETSFSVAPGDTHRVVCYFSPTRDVPPDVNYPTTATVKTNADTVYLSLTGVNHAFNNKVAYENDTFARGLYHFDESPGAQTAIDESGQNLNAAIDGGVHTGESEAVFGTSFKFNGVPPYSKVVIDATPFHDFKDTPFTIELWFRMNTKPQSKYILVRRGDYASQTRQYEIGFQSPNAYGDFGIYGIVWNSGGQPIYVKTGNGNNINAEQWYHVAMTWDSDSLRLYVNSVERDAAFLHGTLYNSGSEPLSIGASYTGDAPLNGYIDEVRISRGVARQSWEFNVNQSRVSVKKDTVTFGNVLKGSDRNLLFRISNPGTQALVIDSVYSKSNLVTVNPLVIPSMNFYVPAGGDTAIWLKYKPTSLTQLNSSLIIASSDPTYPRYKVNLTGKGIETLPAGSYVTDPFTICLYHFEETDGSNQVFDYSGNNMNGTWTPATRTYNSKFGDKALSFDGQNDVCVITPSQGQFIGPEWGGLTAELWFYLADNIPGKGTLISRGNSSGMQFDLAVDNQNLIGRVFYHDGQEVSVTTSGIQKEQWYHSAIVLDRDSLRLYINGTQLDAAKVNQPIKGSRKGSTFDTVPLYFGNSYLGNEPLQGFLDEIRVSNVARHPWEFNVGMARADLDSTTLHFGDVVLPGERELSVKIYNPGIDTLKITNIVSSLTSIFATVETEMNVLPGKTKELPITFYPKDAKSYEGNITMKTNDPFWPELKILLYGSAISEKIPGSYSNDIFTTGLYHFTTLSGDTVVIDSSSSEANGKVKGEDGGVTLKDQGRFGPCLSLNGSKKGYLELPLPELFSESHSFTAEMWFSMDKKPTIIDNRYYLFIAGSENKPKLGIFIDPQRGLVGSVWDKNSTRHDIESGNIDTLKINQWYNASLIWNGEKVYLSLNNEKVDSLVFSDTLQTSNTDSVYVGSRFGIDSFFNGCVDELRLSRIARKSWEVNVLPRKISVSSVNLDFSTVLLGQARSLPVQVSNLGDQDLYISETILTNSTFSVSSSAFLLNGLKKKLILINYSPKIVGDDTGSVILYSNDSDKPSIRIRLAGSCAKGGQIGAPALDSHTIALYRFEETSGSTVYDSTNNKNNGTINGALRTKGFLEKGRGLQFDGINDYVQIVQNPSSTVLSFDLSQQSFTIEFYFKTDTLSETLISMGQEKEEPGFEISVNNEGRIAVLGFGQGGPRVNDNVWHHLAFTYSSLDNQTGKLYIDGTEKWSKEFNRTDITAISSPVLIGASYDTLGTTHYYEGLFDELRISDIVRMRWEFNFIDVGVAVDSLSPAEPKFQQDATVYIHVPVSLEAYEDSVYVHYRNAGEIQYSDVKASKLNDSTFTALIPGSEQTLTGLEYYVSYVFVVDEQDEKFTQPLADPKNNPLSAQVKYTSAASEQKIRAKSYRMISVPFKLDSTDIPSVLEDDLGVFNPYKWKLFWWHRKDEKYIEYNHSADKNIFDFSPGRAFWIITDNDATFDVGSGLTVTTDSSYALSIEPGWNMIGVPYNFSVNWDDCSRSTDSIRTLWYYNYTNGNQMDYAVLEPWKGYWILNTDITSGTLLIPPKKAETAVLKTINNGLLSDLEDGSWLIKISAWNEFSKDIDNFIGVRRGAASGRDNFDRFEPPSIGDYYVRITVGNTEDTASKREFAADIREPGKQGYVWFANVEGSPKDKNIELSWSFISSLPDGWKVYLFDLFEGTSVNMGSLSRMDFNGIAEGEFKRTFKIIAGTEEFIQEKSDGMPIGPVKFELQQNYPNPFNPETVINYSIQKRGPVKLVIFNTLGQVVKVLKNKQEKPGNYSVIWDGRDALGRSVSSGVYLYRLSSSGKVLSHKMVVIH
ncbi:choice-of-anchor D domain-containing protein [bacterium]|nr:choice-of-anchor D domain-containing protein [bacterium]